MVEVLNERYATEDFSSLPIPTNKYEKDKSGHLVQLFVTPEMIAKKIKKVKDNK